MNYNKYKNSLINDNIFGEKSNKINSIEWRKNNNLLNNKHNKYKKCHNNIFSSKIDNIPGPNIKADNKFIKNDNNFIKKNQIDFPKYKINNKNECKTTFSSLYY